MPSPDRPAEMTNARVLAVATAVTVTVVLWGILVFAAIDFGRSARSGTAQDWLFLVLATLGAVGCMFAAIVMAARMQAMLRMSSRSSTRPLSIPLEPLDPVPSALAETPGTAATQPRSPAATAATYPTGATGSPGPTAAPARPAGRAPRNPDAGKRAMRG